ncbi:MAG: hypothetical protein K0R54_1413 [Clostridiaceae bacterium]|jgi:hypothetical protein|nr:hypothetical protein [Clostridiaceae bacterium]
MPPAQPHDLGETDFIIKLQPFFFILNKALSSTVIIAHLHTYIGYTHYITNYYHGQVNIKKYFTKYV